ncbi:hypothetical protein C8R43DRAFT_557444 [Mycena crocata]|nr:hypothetical protein C8R43DRAFT_557444 [Mycena crocata]
MDFRSTSPPSLADPRLPPELERQIFETSALAHCQPVATLNLMLVAWRVKNWVEPLLYRTVVLVDSENRGGGSHSSTISVHDFLAIINQKSPQFFSNVRSLSLRATAADDIASMNIILATTTNINNVFIARLISLKTCPALGTLRPRRLAAHLTALFYGRSIDFMHPIFLYVTHLELYDYRSTIHTEPDWQGLTKIPHLTHLAFRRPSLQGLLFPILLACARLECIVFFSNGTLVTEDPMLPDDVRCVKMNHPPHITDWVAGAKTGEDFWFRAEAIIAARGADAGRIADRCELAYFLENSPHCLSFPLTFSIGILRLAVFDRCVELRPFLPLFPALQL